MSPEEQYNQAQHLLATGDHSSAYKILKKLDATIPNHPGVLYLLATCQSLSGSKTNAIANYLRVIKIQPNFIEAYNNIGLDLSSLGRHQDALGYFDKALKINRSFKEAALNRASTLISMHRLDEAISELEILLKSEPSSSSILTNIGNAFSSANKFEGALNYYEAALIQNPKDAKLLGYKASALEALGRWDECIRTLAKIAPDAPEKTKLKTTEIHAQLKINDWTPLNSERGSFETELLPLAYLYSCSTQPSQLKNTKLHAERYKASESLPPTDNKNIRLGYISADFRNHPVGFLTAGIFKAHDRSAFEVICFSNTSPDKCNDEISARIQENCDKFVYLNELGDDEAIELIRSFKLDVAFDLGGYTASARTTLLAARVAPIQISYLGFPGGMGASFIDYLIGDPIVTPKHLYPFYVEKIISLPETFQANDDARKIKPTSLQEQQLPNNATVLACFNQSAKITPEIFKIWMIALQETPSAILWLAKECDSQVENLRLEAKNAGVDPDRLYFAERAPYANHLGRYELVDLALDTAPFNGGTTTSDALWGGAPVLTLCGETYANRMAASLLHAVGLELLITNTLDTYKSKLLELVNNPNELAHLKEELKVNKGHSTLFNTNLFTRQLESGLKIAVARNRSNLPPEHIEVPMSLPDELGT